MVGVNNIVHTAFWRSERGMILILVGLCLLLFFFGLGAQPLWDVDEGMHAATSKDMVISGDWVTPTYNGENFYDKPIFYNWLAACSFLILGFTEFAARLPAATIGLGCVLTTYFLGRRMFERRVGFLGAAILATSGMFIILSRAVVHDICLTFFITLAFYFFYCGYSDGTRRKLYLWLMYAAGGGAVLAKGPVGLVLPAASIGIFLIYRRDIRFVKEMKIATGMLIFILIAAPWYILISLKNPDYARYFFIEKNVGSFVSNEAVHQEPIYYYLDILFGGFFPWSCLLPLALVRAVRSRSSRFGESKVYLLIWIAVVFLFFSLARSKLPTYILPLFPAAALLVAALWQELLYTRSPGLHRGFFYSFLPPVVLFPLGLLYVVVFPPEGLTPSIGITMGKLYIGALLMSTAFGSAFVLLSRKRYEIFFGALIGTMVAAVIAFTLFMAPVVSSYRSTKTLARQLDGLIPPEEDLVFYRKEKDSALFYTHRRARILHGPKELRAYLEAPERVYFIAQEKYLERVDKILKKAFVIAREGNTMIISNLKPAS